MKIAVCFVCHGNICRSPMAEFVLRDMAERQGLSQTIAVCSRAESEEEIWRGRGNPVYPPVRELLWRHGINCDEKRAQLLTAEDYAQSDLVIAMDSSNLRAMHRLLGGDPHHKFRLLLDYTETPGDIADPWYSRDFETTWRQITAGCAGFLEQLKKEKKL